MAADTFGSFRLGPGGRRFKSCLPDHDLPAKSGPRRASHRSREWRYVAVLEPATARFRAGCAALGLETPQSARDDSYGASLPTIARATCRPGRVSPGLVGTVSMWRLWDSRGGDGPSSSVRPS